MKRKILMVFRHDCAQFMNEDPRRKCPKDTETVEITADIDPKYGIYYRPEPICMYTRFALRFIGEVME